MTNWRFLGTDVDVQAWLHNPRQSPIMIEYAPGGQASRRRRIAVATSDWLQRQAAEVQQGAQIVGAERLTQIVEDATQNPGLTAFAIAVDDEWPTG